MPDTWAVLATPTSVTTLGTGRHDCVRLDAASVHRDDHARVRSVEFAATAHDAVVASWSVRAPKPAHRL